MYRKKVCAVVPAFREEERIETVLKELQKARYIDEIIVVDDGSKDGTEEKVKKMGIKCIVNKKNSGKGFAMERGVNNTNAEIIFFCDADLIGFTGKMADKIIEPMLKENVDMSIGTFRESHVKYRNRLILWCGERALKRELWNKLPKFYKKGFRIELGLNLLCRYYTLVKLNYSRVIKEKKHGYLEGMYRRFFMYLQILEALIRFVFYDAWKAKIEFTQDPTHQRLRRSQHHNSH